MLICCDRFSLDYKSSEILFMKQLTVRVCTLTLDVDRKSIKNVEIRERAKDLFSKGGNKEVRSFPRLVFF